LGPHPARERACRTTSPEQTRRLGRALAARLCPGDLICLRGALGAGKTTLIQGLAEGLGVRDWVTSPSFTIVHQHEGRVPLYHLDLYRLGPGDLREIGIEEILAGRAVVAVEWAERLPEDLWDDALEIDMRFDECCDDLRHIALRARGPRGERILEDLAICHASSGN